VGEGDEPPVAVVRHEIRSVAWVTAGLGAVVLVLGTVVTGSGPHSGDAATPRFGFDPRTISWLHADAVMLFVGLVVAVLLAVQLTATDPRPRRVWHSVFGVTVLQGLVGYTQYLTGLPEVLVMVHMLGASLLAVALTYGVLSLRRRESSNPSDPARRPGLTATGTGAGSEAASRPPQRRIRASDS